MVCVTPEPRCECIIRVPSNDTMRKFEVTLPASTQVNELINQVANNLKYEPHSFQLTFALGGVLTEKTTGTLEAAGLRSGPGNRNSFVLEGIDGRQKNLVPMPSEPEETSAAAPPPPPPPPLEDRHQIDVHSYKRCALKTRLEGSAAIPSTDYTFSTPVIRHETGFVGLVNQAMTCYLNSLLQALFMTPEFRNALYKWKFDPNNCSSADKSIPFQLQKLFLNLQTSTKTAVETTELTRSFGWESGEVWQQHDIQELCRVMFDALEQEFKETEQADLINQLYQGKMIDYVKCLECGTAKSREDTFLDIPLPVRPFGSTVAYGSIQEALKAFVQPETLDGNNQYLCDNCAKKCDAHKGLKFTKFPYLLTLHLKRFDFDYSTLNRIKLNDKVIFPDILDLNSFVNSNITNEADSIAQDSTSIKTDDTSVADSVLDEDSSNPTETSNNEVDQDEDEGIDVQSGNNQENEKNRLNSGPFIYELYSIMIHSGSASGGHYYAYIKDFAKKEWYCFNDQTVTSITPEDIKKTYGGPAGSGRVYYSGAYSSSTNAYMLMYRQINTGKNCYAMVEEEFPPHIKEHLEQLKEQEEQEKARRAKQEEMVRIKIYANHPVLGQPKSEKLFCPPDMTLEEVKDLGYNRLELESVVPKDQCRLVLYDKNQDEIIESLDGQEKEVVKDKFNPKSSYNEVLIEIRKKNEKFLQYSAGDIRLTVYLFEPEDNSVRGPFEVRTSPCQTLADLKQLLLSYIPLKTDDIHLVLVKLMTTLEYIGVNDLPLNKQGFTTGSSSKIFICYKGEEGDLSGIFPDSDLCKQLEEVKNIITLHVSLPDTKKETLEALLIPPLVDEAADAEEEKPSDSTPTGEGLPLVNGLQEEELGCGSGAGGTSDQSTSEDSSLTDSDRTIIGEAVNECPFSTPTDSDQHPLPLSDSQTFGKKNGESNVWEPEQECNLYFRATPYFGEDGQKMLKVVMDKTMDMNIFKKKLEKYIGVDSTYMKLLKGPDGLKFVSIQRSCKDDEKIAVKLERVLHDGEHKISVNHFDPNSTNPIQHIFDWIVSEGESIASLKKALVKEVEKRSPSLKMPYERCRLRKKGPKNPGGVLLDSDVWTEEGYTPSRQQDVYLQQLDGPEPVTSSSQALIFTRRWHPSENTLTPFTEIVVDASTNLCQKLAEVSGINVENVKFANSKTSFPGESVSQVNDLRWQSDMLSKIDPECDNGQIVFYRDDRDEIKCKSKTERILESSETNSSENTFSYISSYSPRKEKALKIYLDTNSRRTRSAIDVD